jgi:DNA-binding PadR family transcriptional regulator
MKLNYDLVRDLLLLIEEKSDGHKNFSLFFFFDEIPNYSKDSIDYHLKYLHDANLIECTDNYDYVIDITPYGRDYLNNIRNDGIWQSTKEKFQPLGSVTLSVVSEIAKSLLLKQLGL